MNFHADILGQRILQPMPQLDPIPHANQEQRGYIQNRDINDSVHVNQIDIVKQDGKQTTVIKREDEFSKKKEIKPIVKKDPSVDNLDGIILEADSVLENTPWSMAMDKYLDKDLDIDLDLLLEDALLENTLKMEEESSKKKRELNEKDPTYDENSTKKPQFTINDDFEDSSLPRTSGFVSVIRGPEMVFSGEELNLLTRIKIIHTDISRRAMPISLHQACVADHGFTALL